jgi:hypothetical protein
MIKVIFIFVDQIYCVSQLDLYFEWLVNNRLTASEDDAVKGRRFNQQTVKVTECDHC